MVDKDKRELLDHEIMFLDKEQLELVNYMQLFKEVSP